ncbi:MAG: hypothetical protein LBJ00_18700 [Planctomycetaceae bacterium]|nr:hypothetical protein [Planctomycetaceae bacterium]
MIPTSQKNLHSLHHKPVNATGFARKQPLCLVTFTHSTSRISKQLQLETPFHHNTKRHENYLLFVYLVKYRLRYKHIPQNRSHSTRPDKKTQFDFITHVTHPGKNWVKMHLKTGLFV